MNRTRKNNRIQTALLWMLALFIGFLAAHFTYSIALSPTDQPNSEVFPLLPGIVVFAASHGFRESSLPNAGPVAFFIAAFNACFYIVLVLLVYQSFYGSRQNDTSHKKDLP
jgi:hypothetical protein